MKILNSKTHTSHSVQAVVLSAALVLFCASSLFARTFRFEYDHELQMKPGSILRVHNGDGNITVRGQADLDHLVIQAIKTVHAVDESAAQEVAGFVKLKLSSNANEARVETIVERIENQQRSFWQRLVGTEDDWFESVDYVITAPAETNVMIVAGSGTIELRALIGSADISSPLSELSCADVQGDLMIDVTSGEVNLREINGDVEVTSTRAPIEVTSLIGDLTIHGGAGDLTAEFVEGSVQVVQTSGDIKIQRLRGDARVKVTSGKIIVEQDSGALDLFSHTGEIDIRSELFSDRDYVVETLSGQITFTFPDNTGANLQVETLSGEIDTRGLPIEVETFSRQEISGLVAGGGVQVSLKSDAGDIRLGWF